MGNTKASGAKRAGPAPKEKASVLFNMRVAPAEIRAWRACAEAQGFPMGGVAHAGGGVSAWLRELANTACARSAAGKPKGGR
jgi:hypothetical protein